MASRLKRFPTALCFSFPALTVLLFSGRGGDHTVLALSLALHLLASLAAGIYLTRQRAVFAFVWARLGVLSKAQAAASVILALGYCALLTKNCFLIHPDMLQESSLIPVVSGLLGLGSGATVWLLTGAAILCGLLSLPLLLLLSALLLSLIAPPIGRFLRSLTRWEGIAAGCFLLMMLALILVSAVKNPLFFHKLDEQGQITYHGVFSAESCTLVHNDIFAAPLFDDARHPLMGLVTLPFALAAWAMALLTWALSLLRTDLYLLYGMALSMIQSLLVAVGAILLKRLIQRRAGPRIAGSLMVFFLCTFPAVFFSLMVERYAFAFFFLILLACLLDKKEPNAWACTAVFVASVGLFSTSAVLLPFVALAFRREGQFQWIWIRRAVLAVLLLLAVSGRLPVLLGFFGFSGGFLEKFADPLGAENPAKYLIFLRALTACPPYVVHWADILQATPVTLSPPTWILGGLTVLSALLGLLLNRRDRFAWLCGYWAAFSVILLLVVGLGAADNEMALYTIYFSWAFVGLLGLLLAKGANKAPRLLSGGVLAAGAVLLCYNLAQWWIMLSP